MKRAVRRFFFVAVLCSIGAAGAANADPADQCWASCAATFDASVKACPGQVIEPTGNQTIDPKRQKDYQSCKDAAFAQLSSCRSSCPKK
jgi:hypothetical protein